MVKRANSVECVVSFLNSQSAHGQGTLVSLNRHMVVFEVYNPYSIVQLSEVLQEVRIRRGGRDVYQGRAVVTNLVNTGLMLIVSASLVEPWADFAHLEPGPKLRGEVQNFIADWDVGSESLLPEYQVAVTRFRSFLLELSRWLEHGETLAGIDEPDVPQDLVSEFVADVDMEVRNRLHEFFAEFEAVAREVPRKLASHHRAFAQRALHPMILCAPFMYRTFAKPLGYAGDYKMVNMMLGEPLDGTSTFAKVLNASALRADAPAAHRNRIQILANTLQAECRKAADARRPLRALNIGCGPAAEIQQFIQESWLSDNLDIELVDFNQETLDYARSTTEKLCREHHRHTKMKFTLKSVNDLIRDATSETKTVENPFDLVYCAGLFDYFGDPTCEALLSLFYDWTAPGGLVVVTNVAPENSTVGFMSHLLEWNLRLRDTEQLAQMAAVLGQPDVSYDTTGVNVFLTLRKPSLVPVEQT